jgi:hypothetical protein
MGKKKLFAVLLVCAVLLSLLGWWLGRQSTEGSGFPLDDAWIHQTYARSLERGGGWSFTPGVPSAGATAPLWVLLLVPGYWFGFSPFTWIAILAVIQLWAVGALGMRAWRLMDLGEGWWGWLAGILLILEWHLIWAALSGMETLLYGLIALSVICLLLRITRKASPQLWLWFVLGAIVGGSVWIRPEAVTLLGPIGFVALLNAEKPMPQRLRHLAIAFLGFLVLFAAYLLFNQWLAGSWWPNTFYAKQAEYEVLQTIPLLTRLLNQFSPLMAGVLAALIPGFIANIYFSIKQRSWVALSGTLWVLGHIGMYAYRLPVIYQHGRYVIPVVPLFVLLGFAGFYQIINLISNQRIQWIISRVWGGVITGVLVLFWFLGMQSYLDDVSMIDGEMVLTASWLEANTSEEELIAAHDIGAIGYFTQRSILDLAGLVSPDVIPFIRDESELAWFMDQECPRYLVTFPGWYPQLTEMGNLVFQTNTSITLEIGGENMAVYRWIGAGTCP